MASFFHSRLFKAAAGLRNIAGKDNTALKTFSEDIPKVQEAFEAYYIAVIESKQRIPDLMDEYFDQASTLEADNRSKAELAKLRAEALQRYLNFSNKIENLAKGNIKNTKLLQAEGRFVTDFRNHYRDRAVALGQDDEWKKYIEPFDQAMVAKKTKAVESTKPSAPRPQTGLHRRT
jgi:hypothetical protein